MQYDYTGMRVKKDAPTGMTLFPFKGYEIAPDGTITKFIRIGIETFASKKRTTSGATSQFFYHNDHLGGVDVITDGSGARCQLNEYDPWGGESRSEGATPGTPATCDPTHRFTGQELDPESGLYYYAGRYYDQEISRFISPDPYVQEPDDPQNLNRYTYVLNNPQGYVDPNGHFLFELFSAIVAIVTSIEAFSSAAIIVEGTVVGINVGNVILGVASLAQAGYWGSQLAKSAELQQLAQNRAVQAQSQNNINNLRSDKLEDPNRGTGNAGNDDPNGSSWWKDVWNTIGPSDAHAAGGKDDVPPNSAIINRAVLEAAKKAANQAGKIGKQAAKGGHKAVYREPRNLRDKLAIDAAKAKASNPDDRIMEGRIKDPNYPADTWGKFQHVHGAGKDKIVIHYWENLKTGLREGFKIVVD